MKTWTMLFALLLVGACAGDRVPVQPMTGADSLGGQDPSSRLARSPSRPELRLDYKAHIAKLRRRLPHAGFSIVIQKPFVVVGDESPASVKRRARGTVKWAVDLLKKAYFGKDPDHIIDVWLFKNRGSYQKHTRALFGEAPGTPFGYYSPTHRALIMNIATGGGTLVHEIVHPFVAANFPDCPSWFNEGLGSLYEQSREVDGKIIGMTNWRLPPLQKSIRSGTVLPTFEQLTATSTRAFYEEDRGNNYAQARYLCYYLQQKGLLRRYYRRFLQNRATDPTGYRSLQQVLGKKPEEMAAWQQEWQEYVLKLRYR